ncbi:hypothetical protein CENSYa_1041 [Cenarchaeum symbiosum A]|uniref:Mrr-like domain-containing protein n=1 Tax=Cenarchaeum symbiosum (strain A) TaxID=414004 RepID=A0RWF5_CENSY|nr:hypothetical protein CENSYa_1041 [Cenarchaeum symbiosum A]
MTEEFSKKGTEYEGMVFKILKGDARFASVQHWKDAYGKDVGIDFVGTRTSGGEYAIQVEYRDHDVTIDVNDIEGFVAKASEVNMPMIFVYSGKSIGPAAKKLLDDHDCIIWRHTFNYLASLLNKLPD